MPKFEEAFYINEHGKTKLVSYKELVSEERRAELRKKDLKESPNGFYQLGVRNHETTPHFFQKRPIRKNIDTGSKESEKHEEHKQMLYNFLNKYAKHEFGYYATPWDKNNKLYEAFSKAKDYQWEKEVSFGLIYGRYIRFDILGRSSKELSLTDKYPYIAIEVVDTHFHSQQAFKALLELTKNMPVIVIYYFINKAPYLNTVNTPGKTTEFSKNRFQYYLSDGSLWVRNYRIEETLENINPGDQEVYYNIIEKRLYDEGCIRKNNNK